MRLLHTADVHLGLTRHGHPTARGGNSRIDDFAATLDAIVDRAIAERVAAVLFAGDTFHTRREGPQERNVLARAVARLTTAGHAGGSARGVSVVILPGNHDGMSTLGDASTHALLWLQSLGMDDVHVLTRPGAHPIQTNDGDLIVVALPYPHKRSFEHLLDSSLSPDDRIIEAGRRMDRIIEQLAPAPDHELPTVLLGHFTTLAAKTGSEQTMKMTWDVSVDPRVFAPYDYVALGHIHQQQQVAPNAWYAGSPEYIDFGEEGQQKGFLIAHVRPGEAPLVEPVATAARPLLTLTLSGPSIDSATGLDPDYIRPGAIVKLKFDTPTRPRPDTIARLRADALRLGASDVVPEWRPSKAAASRARVVLDPATDRTAMLRAWLEAMKLPIEPTLTAGRDLIAARTVGA